MALSIETLSDIEEIRQLKARYIRLGDTKKWDELATLFADDVEVIFEFSPRGRKDDPKAPVHYKGRDALISANAPNLTGVATLHHVFASEITITSPTTATGVWGMHVFVKLPACIFNEWGYYHEIYEKIDAVWKIKRIHQTEIHCDEQWL